VEYAIKQLTQSIPALFIYSSLETHQIKSASVSSFLRHCVPAQPAPPAPQCCEMRCVVFVAASNAATGPLPAFPPAHTHTGIGVGAHPAFSTPSHSIGAAPSAASIAHCAGLLVGRRIRAAAGGASSTAGAYPSISRSSSSSSSGHQRNHRTLLAPSAAAPFARPSAPATRLAHSGSNTDDRSTHSSSSARGSRSALKAGRRLAVVPRAAFLAAATAALATAKAAATAGAAAAAAVFAAGTLPSVGAAAAGGYTLGRAARRWRIAARAGGAGMDGRAGEQHEVTIVTFNVRGVMDRWAERLPLLRETLRQLDADVYCFQEVLTGASSSTAGSDDGYAPRHCLCAVALLAGALQFISNSTPNHLHFPPEQTLPPNKYHHPKQQLNNPPAPPASTTPLPLCKNQQPPGEFQQDKQLLPDAYTVYECRAALDSVAAAGLAGGCYAAAMRALLSLAPCRAALVAAPASVEGWRERNEYSGGWARSLRDVAIAPFFGNSIATRLPAAGGAVAAAGGAAVASETLLLGSFRAAQRVCLAVGGSGGVDRAGDGSDGGGRGGGVDGEEEPLLVWLVNTHLDHSSPEVREAQTKVRGLRGQTGCLVVGRGLINCCCWGSGGFLVMDANHITTHPVMRSVSATPTHTSHEQ